MVRVFENLMSRNDELKVGLSQWPERDMFLSHMGCISLITMKQIKSFVFFAIFDQCPILTCPGMTNYHNISDLDKTCCVNYTCNGKVKTKNLPNERAYRPLRIKIGRQIVRNQEEEGTENLEDAILVPVRESLRARRRQAAYKHK